MLKRVHRIFNGLHLQRNNFDLLNDLAPLQRWLALGVLFVALTLTLIASLYIKNESETVAENKFAFIRNEIQLNIADRLAASAMVLYSGSALFNASQDVSRAEWHNFTSGLRLDQQIPGTQGLGYAMLIPSDQLEQHIRQVRSEGFPDYTVRPEGQRDLYSSIVYLEPFNGRNLRAFGYDMFSEPTRRAAMERARDGNSAALSGKVTLVQETDQDVQAGVLLYVPVYRTDMPIETVTQRRAALQGWVYSPYRMDDMMRGTLGDDDLKQDNQHVIVQIYDGNSIAPEALLYDSNRERRNTVAASSKDISNVTSVVFFGRSWTIRFTQPGGLETITDYDSFRLVSIGGSSISLLLFVLITFMLRSAHYLKALQQLADTDSLTGVYNRRKILELGEEEFVRARRHHKPLSILMIDLNYFKSTNDNFGHSVGDQVLRLTASTIQNTLRKDIDRVGRFGGDEFVILLPETSLEQVGPVIVRLRHSAAQVTQYLADGLAPVSLSIGAAELEDSTRSLHDLVELADQAMYLDKKQIKGQ